MCSCQAWDRIGVERGETFVRARRKAVSVDGEACELADQAGSRHADLERDAGAEGALEAREREHDRARVAVALARGRDAALRSRPAAATCAGHADPRAHGGLHAAETQADPAGGLDAPDAPDREG